MNDMNVVMIIPTGIGCEIGGHAGDATPAARLLASVCDKLLLHPNVVNASDINEMPENSLYIEGSMLDRFLEGEIELQEVRSNEILVAVNEPAHSETINAVSAARATLGIDASVVVLGTPLRMKSIMSSEGASGEVSGWKELVRQVACYQFDALAVASEVEVDEKIAFNYWVHGGINPWGGVEAVASKLIANQLNKPVAHAPLCIGNKQEESDFVTDPRVSAEVISWAFLHCVLKGLYRAPCIGKGLSVEDIDVMVSPNGCWGRPHRACKKAGIPIIEVEENRTIFSKNIAYNTIWVDNYFEAAGVIAAMREGITLGSVRRPLEKTSIY